MGNTNEGATSFEVMFDREKEVRSDINAKRHGKRAVSDFQAHQMMHHRAARLRQSTTDKCTHAAAKSHNITAKLSQMNGKPAVNDFRKESWSIDEVESVHQFIYRTTF